jgi:glycosyltransferase involved in cell wall biosynthesis
VTAYYNRKELFHRTLKSITKTKYDNFEIIAVDDASRKEERIEDLAIGFPFLRVIRIEPKDKWYKSAIIPLNLGISLADGDIIVLQNPECLHVHDVLSHIVEKINDLDYISISAYSFNEELTNTLPAQIDGEDFIGYFESLPQQTVDGYVGWYNHSTYRPVHFNFCAALTGKNMKSLGGFDERYAMGLGFEDDEFIGRITKMGLNKIISEEVSVIHQWHPKVFDLADDGNLALFLSNRELYLETRNEKTYTVNNSFNK